MLKNDSLYTSQPQGEFNRGSRKIKVLSPSLMLVEADKVGGHDSWVRFFGEERRLTQILYLACDRLVH